jgi:hypothetical protein
MTSCFAGEEDKLLVTLTAAEDMKLSQIKLFRGFVVRQAHHGRICPVRGELVEGRD